jgi:hypothetical protein
MRAWLFAIGLIASTCSAVGESWTDLDRPGAMAALERENPSHFAKIERMLHEAPAQSVTSIPRWMRIQFDAKDVQTRSLLKTSYPPQTRVSFVLDNARYSKTIYVDAPGKVIPAK